MVRHSSLFIASLRRNTLFVFTTRSPTFDPIVRATSVNRSVTAAGGAAFGDGVALRLPAFFAAGRADFFFAVLPLLFLLGIPLPRLSRAVYDKNATVGPGSSPGLVILSEGARPSRRTPAPLTPHLLPMAIPTSDHGSSFFILHSSIFILLARLISPNAPCATALSRSAPGNQSGTLPCTRSSTAAGQHRCPAFLTRTPPCPLRR